MSSNPPPQTTAAPAGAGGAPTVGAPAAAAQAAAAASSAAAPAGSRSNAPAAAAGQNKLEVTDQAVLDYLKRRGLQNAAHELLGMLEKKQQKDGGDGKPKDRVPSASSSSKVGSGGGNLRERLEEEDAASRNQRSLLSKSTGGGYGYDRDAAWPIAHWGVPDTGRQLPLKGTTATGGAGEEEDQLELQQQQKLQNSSNLGVAESRAYLDAFTALQLWVLSLPDHDGRQVLDNPLRHAQALVHSKQQQQQKGDDKTGGSSTTAAAAAAASLSDVVQELKHRKATGGGDTHIHLPPSAKPELLAVTFALLVHTYCELLEVGMESTAHTIRDAFRPVYESLYGNEYRDMYQCTTVEDIVRLNSHNSQHMEALSSLKSILVQVASYQLRREELNAQAAMTAPNAAHDDRDRQQAQLREAKIQEYDRNIGLLKRKYSELSQRASLAFDKMHDLPFLRRARAVRWQLTLSRATYGLLAAFLQDEARMAMSTLLQTKCELHVERRDPLPFTPAVVLLEDGGAATTAEPALNLNRVEINWAAPVALRDWNSVGERAPFPKYHLDEEYDTREEADVDKQRVEFNRAVLINGFRRLEALERKRDYESMSSAGRKRLLEGEDDGSISETAPPAVADPLQPTCLLTTLCASSSSTAPVARPKTASSGGRGSGNYALNDVSTIWEEPGIGLCSAKISPPDGRRVAVGCDDSCIRIWDIVDHASGGGGGGGGNIKTEHQAQQRSEPCAILLGHKNGFPVFDVDWNRDGRSLLSAGGDGSVRLWDTMAVGPFGEVVPLSQQQSSKQATSTTLSSTTGKAEAASADPMPMSVDTPKSKREPDMDVPGWRAEDVPYASGAALAVYRGHAPSSPVWSVSFAPCGYYFASAGADATARLWTTDRAVPVRLFCGHTSSNVNCVGWHPNCNYIVTGGDDKTARLWDIQTGRSVRLLDGCGAGINVVKISPGGKYLAGADYSGVVHLWDLGMGKKVTEFAGNTAIHQLSFSACGSALAAGGDDCCVSIWDVRSAAIADSPVVVKPIKSFQTRNTQIMDLHFTKRNLLLSVGKFVTPALVTPAQ